MTVRNILGYIVIALLAWMASAQIDRSDPPSASAPVALAAPATVPAGSAAPERNDAAPLIAVSSDGNVTLRVEQQPLEWVLEQIATQSGWSDVKQRAGAGPSRAVAVAPAPSAAPAACAEAALPTQKQAKQLLEAIERGGEADRYEGLVQARSNGVPLPEELLKTLFETDGSERVRVLAFEAYLEPRIGSVDAMRSALEAALYAPDGVIQREARQWLDELLDGERMDAAAQRAAP